MHIFHLHSISKLNTQIMIFCDVCFHVLCCVISENIAKILDTKGCFSSRISEGNFIK